MTQLDTILEFNRKFVADKEYEKYMTDKFPEKKMAIVTCMDTRLVELLPKAMNLRNGDVKLIKNAGALISHPFGSVMRSLLVAIYELRAQEVYIVGHTGCGMAALNSDQMIGSMRERGISEDVLNTLEHSGIKLNEWLRGVDNEKQGVIQTVNLVKNHPLLPAGVPVHGMLIDSTTGELEVVVNGYEE
ncbi:carbonic anhydrase [Paenibacillus macerans]|uniref:carbonic anhydrase n=1 Tax=Paenibacillus macerans TaxID=44252 RepID=A0A090ZK60_PAEMA|nr:carbonic anhydrase [Paenibacillus macerans]KFN11017.1 carbonic anhydrase family protein [Paenibacillus macerans]MBS5912611.1 carbonic anhydrase [Paenibacillus macerans]MCY7560866.1 carbonic anhydrase [Paenibacillus macerans]MDU7476564.1 carbonic anhydrase [Paenibacillus macerans]MEC0152214.1 carbonic anhydrase [Paenibacillus macerans]